MIMKQCWQLFFCCLLLLLAPLPLSAAPRRAVASIHSLFGGPECFRLKREREGGTQQSGALYGGRIGYERLCPWKIYGSLQGRYASGTLHGKTGGGSPLLSCMTEIECDLNLGYTLASSRRSCLLTPILGLGFFYEENAFDPISPLPVTFHLSYRYISGGCNLSLRSGRSLSLGLNVQALLPYGSRSKISDDPELGALKIPFNEKVAYVIDLPITAHHAWRHRKIGASFVPFYRSRHYGGRENYPFDFYDTRVHVWGARLMLIAHF